MVQINFFIEPPLCVVIPRSTIYFLGILQILVGLGDLGPNISEVDQDHLVPKTSSLGGVDSWRLY